MLLRYSLFFATIALQADSVYPLTARDYTTDQFGNPGLGNACNPDAVLGVGCPLTFNVPQFDGIPVSVTYSFSDLEA